MINYNDKKEMKAVNVAATKVCNKDGNISEKTLTRKVKQSSTTAMKQQKEQRDGGRKRKK